MGDDIGSGSVTDCCLRSDSDPLSSTNLQYGENHNKPFYRFRCHHPLITQLTLYHNWDVKNGFAFVLQFFSLISDSLGGVNSFDLTCAQKL